MVSVKQLVLTSFISDYSEVGIKRMKYTGGECETTGTYPLLCRDKSEVEMKNVNMI